MCKAENLLSDKLRIDNLIKRIGGYKSVQIIEDVKVIFWSTSENMWEDPNSTILDSALLNFWCKSNSIPNNPKYWTDPDKTLFTLRFL